jgi:hypothetical protein
LLLLLLLFGREMWWWWSSGLPPWRLFNYNRIKMADQRKSFYSFFSSILVERCWLMKLYSNGYPICRWR